MIVARSSLLGGESGDLEQSPAFPLGCWRWQEWSIFKSIYCLEKLRKKIISTF
jgi:hypothetical protein